MEWLGGESLKLELRDEGLLRLFFAHSLEPTQALALVRSIRLRHEERLEQLREAEPHAAAGGVFTNLVLEYGFSVHAAARDWAEAAERRLQAEIERD